MTNTEWNEKADRLKKCLDYAPPGPAVQAARAALEAHLAIESSVTPDPAPVLQPMWECTTDEFPKVLTHAQYQNQPWDRQRWYRPMRVVAGSY